MNDIKFRYFVKFNEHMEYSDNFENLSEFFRQYQKEVEGGNEPKLMHFTGVDDDVNGRNIYECDIVKDNEGGIYVVHRLDGKGFFFLSSCEDDEYNCTMTGVITEVIGNIHEPPELLEEASES